jgi:hypothetical protein
VVSLPLLSPPLVLPSAAVVEVARVVVASPDDALVVVPAPSVTWPDPPPVVPVEGSGLGVPRLLAPPS